MLTRRSEEKESPPRGGTAQRPCEKGRDELSGSLRSGPQDQTRWCSPSRSHVVFACGRAWSRGDLPLAPRAQALEVLRGLASRERALRRSFGAWVAGSRFRGVDSVSLKGTRFEDRPWWRGNPKSRERTRRGIKASKRAEFAVRAITVSWIQGNWELGFGRVKGSP